MSKTPKSQQSDEPVEMPNEELEVLKQEVLDLTEALQRERADSTNLRRQHEEQVAGLKDHLKGDVVKHLLPVIDNFERSLKHIPDELKDNDYVSGIKGIIKQFEKALEGLGVERIQTDNVIFNPSYHEAVSMEDGEGLHEIVSEELQPGYKIGENVIRHAMVKVKMGDLKSS